MFELFVKFGNIIDIVNRAVNLNAHIAVFTYLFKQLNMFAFFARITGATMSILERNGSSLTLSTTWSMLWRAISLPHLGQCGTPTRAKKASDSHKSP